MLIFVLKGVRELYSASFQRFLHGHAFEFCAFVIQSSRGRLWGDWLEYFACFLPSVGSQLFILSVRSYSRRRLILQGFCLAGENVGRVIWPAHGWPRGVEAGFFLPTVGATCSCMGKTQLSP